MCCFSKRDEYMDFKLFIIVASPLVRKVGLALTGIKTIAKMCL